jgi:tripartite-type tricarboxylate transporter receptor subunit TctC
MLRRQFLRLASLTAASVLPLGRAAAASSYPTRPVRIIVGFAAGGPNDILARLMAQYLSERLGMQFIVENRPGAGSNVATDAVIKAAPDGYTLLFVNASNAINKTLYENLNHDFMRDIAPVAAIARVPNVVDIHPLLPINSIADLIAYAKAHPAKLNAASGGVGSTGHLALELFKMMTGTDLVHVPYRGSAPALLDLIAGQVQIIFDSMPGSVEYIRAGTIRGLAVTTSVRSNALPALPPVGDTVPGYEATSWYGLGAPKDTLADIIAMLNREVNAALADPKLQARYADLGGMVLPGTPDDFAKLIAAETEKWAKVVKFSGAKAS